MIERPKPYHSGVLSTYHSGRMRQLLNDVYHHVARNIQKDVEVELTYEYENADADGSAQEA